MGESTTTEEIESWLREVATDLTEPRPGECLLCFVARSLDEFGCDNQLRFARRFRDLRAPRAVGLERRLGDRGGFCDCEIFLNGWSVHRRLWSPEREVEREGYLEIIEAEPPEKLPPCTGIRLGSTQPCGNWERRRHGW